jgi:hypothetical protein
MAQARRLQDGRTAAGAAATGEAAGASDVRRSG